MTSLAALPAFLAHFLAGLALLGAAFLVFTRFTPHDEMALVRAGNLPAAVALGGSVIGAALAIASAVSHSAGLLDAVVWAVVALLAQLGAFLATARLLPGWRAAIERGEMATAALKAAVAIAVGLVNAAAMVP
jgi:putative membrane protein